MGLILVVDDEQDAGRLVQRVLSASGHKVLSMTDPEQAMNWLQGNIPDLVLLDIKLRGKSGMSLLEYLHQNLPEIKVLLVTGCPSVETREKAGKLGVQDYLIKPIELDELENRVNKLIEVRFQS